MERLQAHVYHGIVVSGQEVTPARIEAAKHANEPETDSLDRDASLYAFSSGGASVTDYKDVLTPHTVCNG